MQDMNEIYSKYAKIVYKYLCYLTHNVDIAEELTQETFCVAVESISKFRKECKIEVWLCQIAKFLWYKEQKRIKKVKDIDIEQIECESEKINNEEEFIRNEQKNSLYKALDKLNDTTKEVILLRISSELTFEQIGKILGRNETWARITFYRGKEKLKEVLKDER